MREILFKGKSLLSGEWVEGYYIGPIGVLDVHEICDIHDITGTRVEVDPSTVCQYTGMTDKNGTKIFEGDIVRYNGERHIVVFETRGGTGYFGIKIDHIETWGFCQSVPAKLMEVIGNIHDNPELVEGLL